MRFAKVGSWQVSEVIRGKLLGLPQIRDLEIVLFTLVFQSLETDPSQFYEWLAS